MDTSPFTYATKSGMIEFTKAILEVEQCLPAYVQVNVNKFLPSNDTVEYTVSRMARRFRSENYNDTQFNKRQILRPPCSLFKSFTDIMQHLKVEN